MAEQANIDKKIKRAIYARPQSVLIIFPPGLADAARVEAESILGDIWFSNKFTSKISLLKNAIRIDEIHMFAVMELMLRGKCFSDIRLILNESYMQNMQAAEKICRDVQWDYYLAPELRFRVKVDVALSPALHEGALKELLQEIIGGSEDEGSALLHLDVYKYRSIMSLSLAGEPLYKRGYKSMLSKSAPLREDIAAACIQHALQFGLKQNAGFVSDILLLPFSGTGTFLIEYLSARYMVSPALFDRAYSLEQMPLFRADTFNHLRKQAKEHCKISQSASKNYLAIDHAAEANEAMCDAIHAFAKAMQEHQLVWSGVNESQCPQLADFLKLDMQKIHAELDGNVFMPMNPPYGIRLCKKNDTVDFYKQIAHQVNAVSEMANSRDKHVLGLILCPSEDAWSAFCKTLKNATMNTYHINQGGLDIRVAEFYV